MKKISIIALIFMVISIFTMNAFAAVPLDETLLMNAVDHTEGPVVPVNVDPYSGYYSSPININGHEERLDPSNVYGAFDAISTSNHNEFFFGVASRQWTNYTFDNLFYNIADVYEGGTDQLKADIKFREVTWGALNSWHAEGTLVFLTGTYVESANGPVAYSSTDKEGNYGYFAGIAGNKEAIKGFTEAQKDAVRQEYATQFGVSGREFHSNSIVMDADGIRSTTYFHMPEEVVYASGITLVDITDYLYDYGTQVGQIGYPSRVGNLGTYTVGSTGVGKQLTFESIEPFNDNTVMQDKVIASLINGEGNTDGYDLDAISVYGYRYQTVDIPFSKVWVGPATSVTINLMNGTTVVDSQELTEAPWSGSFEDKPMYDGDGKLINYTVKEVPIINYTSVVAGSIGRGFVVTNTNNQTVDIPFSKVWVGPATSVTINLMNGTTVVDSQELTEAPWSGSFDDKPMYDGGGNVINYTIKRTPITNYTSAVTGNITDGFVVTNTNNQTVDIPFSKVWVGPATSVTINLMNGTTVVDSKELTGAPWSGSFDDKPMYDGGGKLINYTIKETPITNYASVVTGNITDGFVVTNTNNQTVDIPFSKVWVGPATSVTINLMNGTTVVDSKELTGAPWSGSFEDKPMYDGDGKLINYTVKEVPIINYTSAVTGNITDGFVVTNTNNQTVDIPFSKVWVGPATSVTINLMNGTTVVDSKELTGAPWSGTFDDKPMYDGGGKLINYTIKETPITNYTSVVAGSIGRGFVVTNTNNQTVDIPFSKVWVGPATSVTINLMNGTTVVDSKELTGAPWSGSFEDKPMYDGGGNVINYTVKEVPIINYTSAVTGNITDGFVVTNTNNQTVDIPFSKVWVGPATSVTINLMNGTTVVDSKELTGAPWSGTFEDKPMYDGGGNVINYTIKETPITNYTSVVAGSIGRGFVVTNTNNQTVDIPFSKVWVGPATSVTINLMNGTTVVDSKELTGAPWSGSFDDKPMYDGGGKLINYTIKETPITNYASVVTGNITDGFVVTNTNNQTVDIPFSKVWVGPATSVTINLMNGTTVVDSQELTEAPWSGTFEDKPMYDGGGKLINYTIKETPITNYTSVVAGSIGRGFVVTNTNNQTVDIPFSKVWVGPATSVTINLMNGTTVVDSQELTEAPWSGSFDDKPMYDGGGKLINYTIKETPITNYTSAVTGNITDGFVVTNTNNQTVDIPFSKVWVGPATSVTINLMNGTTVVDSKELTGAPWSGTFEDKSMYDGDGKLINYTIKETPITNYASAVTGNITDGFVVTNTNNQTVDIPFSKVWVGPTTSVTINLMNGTTVVDSQELTEAPWSGSFDDKPMYDGDGNVINYTIKETPIAGYTSAVTGNMTIGFTVTNTRNYDTNTAWGRYDDNDKMALWFLDSPINLNNWGWSNGAFSNITSGTAITFNLYAGNNGPDPSANGVEPVGEVRVTFLDDSIKVIYDMFDGNILTDVHFYIGKTILPLKGKNYISSPGQLTYDASDGYFNGNKEFVMTLDYENYPEIEGILKGNFYIAAHSVVKSPTVQMQAVQQYLPEVSVTIISPKKNK